MEASAKVGEWGVWRFHPSVIIKTGEKKQKTKKKTEGKKKNAVSAMSNLQAPAEEERQSKLRLL